MGMTVLYDSHARVLAVLITLLSHVWLKRGSAIYYTLHSYKEATTSISWRRGTIDHTPWYETQHPAKEFYISRARRHRTSVKTTLSRLTNVQRSNLTEKYNKQASHKNPRVIRQLIRFHLFGVRFSVYCHATFDVNKPRKFGHSVPKQPHVYKLRVAISSSRYYIIQNVKAEE